MFSSFSFGKVIKTILPGFVLTAGIILLLEALTRRYWGPGGSLMVALTGKDLVATVTAVLVPVSLILGFLLNTGVWMLVNPAMRTQVDAELSSTVFPDLRKKLSMRLWQKISAELDDPKIAERQQENPTRDSLEYFYLPIMSLDRLNYLWESYFSWYEFQINTAVALGLFLPGQLLLFWVMLYPGHSELLLLCTLTSILVTTLLVLGLWYAAKGNLLEYRKNLLLLILGSLVLTAKGTASEPQAKSRWWWFKP
jgi:hypothetical protein